MTSKYINEKSSTLWPFWFDDNIPAFWKFLPLSCLQPSDHKWPALICIHFPLKQRGVLWRLSKSLFLRNVNLLLEKWNLFGVRPCENRQNLNCCRSGWACGEVGALAWPPLFLAVTSSWSLCSTSSKTTILEVSTLSSISLLISSLLAPQTAPVLRNSSAVPSSLLDSSQHLSYWPNPRNKL